MAQPPFLRFDGSLADIASWMALQENTNQGQMQPPSSMPTFPGDFSNPSTRPLDQHHSLPPPPQMSDMNSMADRSWNRYAPGNPFSMPSHIPGLGAGPSTFGPPVFPPPHNIPPLAPIPSVAPGKSAPLAPGPSVADSSQTNQRVMSPIIPLSASTTDKEDGEVSDRDPAASGRSSELDGPKSNMVTGHGRSNKRLESQQRQLARPNLTQHKPNDRKLNGTVMTVRKHERNNNTDGRALNQPRKDGNVSADSHTKEVKNTTVQSNAQGQMHDSYRPSPRNDSRAADVPTADEESVHSRAVNAPSGEVFTGASAMQNAMSRAQVLNKERRLEYKSKSGTTEDASLPARRNAGDFVRRLYESGIYFDDLVKNEDLDPVLLRNLYIEQGLPFAHEEGTKGDSTLKSDGTVPSPSASKVTNYPRTTEHAPSTAERLQQSTSVNVNGHLRPSPAITPSKPVSSADTRRRANAVAILDESASQTRPPRSFSEGPPKQPTLVETPTNQAQPDRKEYLARLLAMKTKKSDSPSQSDPERPGIVPSKLPAETPANPSEPSTKLMASSSAHTETDSLDKRIISTHDASEKVHENVAADKRRKELERLRKEALESAKAAAASKLQKVTIPKVSSEVDSSQTLPLPVATSNAKLDSDRRGVIAGESRPETPETLLATRSTATADAAIPGLSMPAASVAPEAPHTIHREEVSISDGIRTAVNSRKRPVAADFDDEADQQQAKRSFGRARYEDDPDECIIEASDNETAASNEEHTMRISDEEVERFLHDSALPETNMTISRQARPALPLQVAELASQPQRARFSPMSVVGKDDLSLRERKIMEMKQKIALIEQRKLAKTQSAQQSGSNTPRSAVAQNFPKHVRSLQESLSDVNAEAISGTAQLENQSISQPPQLTKTSNTADVSNAGHETVQGSTSEGHAATASILSQLDILRARKREIEEQLRLEEARVLSAENDHGARAQELLQPISRDNQVPIPQDIANGPGNQLRMNSGAPGMTMTRLESPGVPELADIHSIPGSSKSSEDTSMRALEPEDTHVNHLSDRETSKAVSAGTSSAVNGNVKESTQNATPMAEQYEEVDNQDQDVDMEIDSESESDKQAASRSTFSSSDNMELALPKADPDTEEGEIRSTSDSLVPSPTVAKQDDQWREADLEAAVSKSPGRPPHDSQNLLPLDLSKENQAERLETAAPLTDSESEDTYEPPDAVAVKVPSEHLEKSQHSASVLNTESQTETSQPPVRRQIIADDDAPELQPDPVRDSPENNAVNHSKMTIEFERFEPYDSPLRLFKSYRYHPQYLKSVSQGYQSLTYSHNIDANLQMCSYDLLGICNDGSCSRQHIKSMSLKDEKILLDLGTSNPGQTDEQRRAYSDGLSHVLKSLRDKGGRGLNDVAEAIANFRRDFFNDPTLILDLQDIR
ncbi:MAG: hypothetical protein M1828_000287 [Chrysothrix sp. TS-e1954]|nr:MAG: hypothetical protein M1828_000287 [Chrysothrix sp. TS-e1954]